MYWITREGEKIKVSEMSNSHIINSINLIKRKLANAPSEYVDGGDSSPVGQAIESENRNNRYIKEELEKALKALTKEMKKRIEGLENPATKGTKRN